MIHIKVEMDIPVDGEYVREDYALDQKLWRKLKLPPGWHKGPMMKGRHRIKIKGTFLRMEDVNFTPELVQDIFTKLLMIKAK